MSEKHLRLQEARKAAGYTSVADAVRALGVSYPTYAAHENGHAGFRADTADLYARKFRVSLDWLLTGRGDMSGSGAIYVQNDIVGLPVLASVEAGHWLETSHMDQVDGETLPVPRDDRFPFARQYALRVKGDAMNLHYPDGSYVTCVDFAESRLPLTPGMIVHVERRRAGGQLVEISLKMVEARKGTVLLVPRSTNANWQPISYLPDDKDVVVRGVVTGGWNRAPIPLK